MKAIHDIQSHQMTAEELNEAFLSKLEAAPESLDASPSIEYTRIVLEESRRNILLRQIFGLPDVE